MAAVSVVSIMLVNSKVAPAPLNSGAVYDATKSTEESGSVHSIVPKAEKSELTFDYTQTGINPSDDKIDVFIDADKNEYLFNDKGEQVGFKKSNNGIDTYSSNVYEINLEKAITIADTVLHETVNTNQNYTMTGAKYIENLNLFSITYHYFAGEYRTSDFALMFISNKGELMSYIAPNVGLFDGVDIPKIDKSGIERTVADYITQTYDCKDYSIEDMMLVKKDGLELSVSYYVTLSDDTVTADAYSINLG